MTKGRKFATADGRIVDEGDQEARFLVAGEDGEVDKELVARLKAEAKGDKSAPAESGVVVDDKTDDAKSTAKADDKAVQKSANK